MLSLALMMALFDRSARAKAVGASSLLESQIFMLDFQAAVTW